MSAVSVFMQLPEWVCDVFERDEIQRVISPSLHGAVRIHNLELEGQHWISMHRIEHPLSSNVALSSFVQKVMLRTTWCFSSEPLSGIEECIPRRVIGQQIHIILLSGNMLSIKLSERTVFRVNVLPKSANCPAKVLSSDLVPNEDGLPL